MAVKNSKTPDCAAAYGGGRDAGASGGRAPVGIVAITGQRGPAGVGRRPFCTCRPWQGRGSKVSGVIHYAMRRPRRSRVRGGFVFSFCFCVRLSRVVCFVSPQALGRCATVLFCLINQSLTLCGNM